MEIAVIGNSEFILGFRLAGIRKTYAAESDEKLNEHITRVLQDGEVGILVLNSSDMEKIPRRLRATLDNSVKPTVIAIGGEEKGGLSMRRESRDRWVLICGSKGQPSKRTETRGPEKDRRPCRYGSQS